MLRLLQTRLQSQRREHFGSAHRQCEPVLRSRDLIRFFELAGSVALCIHITVLNLSTFRFVSYNLIKECDFKNIKKYYFTVN